MSSTPMAIDSPMGANGLGGKAGGALPTAKVSDMISIFRPAKVIPLSGKRLTLTADSTFVVIHQLKVLANRPLRRAREWRAFVLR